MTSAVSAATASPELTGRDVRVLSWQIYLSLIVLAVGLLAGLAQALDRVLPASSSLWRFFPLQQNYYQGLTMHGVLLALLFTFAFSNGFMSLVLARSLRRPPNFPLILGSLILIVVGSVMAGWQIVANKASVLYTMYPPLQATWIYYLGLVLVVVSTWLTALNVVLGYRAWRREHPVERIPLPAYGVVATYVMWFIASLGLAVLTLGLLLPWSLGWIDAIDPQLARTLFWFSGHPVVYFWLLPAYVSWYVMIPAQVRGKIFSDALARFVFALFLVLSIPTGFHHQYTDPGVDPRMKAVQAVITFAIFFPSMITAFSLAAALEIGGRRAGGRGLLGWIRKLPWGDPSVTAQLLAMLGFVLGGISGLINASYTVNLVVHNTAWVPGHFHLTVGTAVALSFMGITYWLLPHLTGRSLRGRRVALTQAWLWLAGVLLMSRGLIDAGLRGEPRRMNVSAMTYDLGGQELAHWMTAVGGVLMFVSGVLFFVVVIWTLSRGAKGTLVEMPICEEYVSGPHETSAVLDRWPLWIGIAVVLTLIAYGPYFLTYTPNFVAPGWAPWG